MNKIIKTLPLLALFTLVGCNSNSVKVKPKNGTKVEAQEAYEALEKTVNYLNEQDAIGATVKKLSVDAKINEKEVTEEKKLQQTADMTVKATNGTLDVALSGIKDETAEPKGAIELKSDVSLKGKAVKEDTGKLEDIKVSGKVDLNAYVSSGDLYVHVDENTGKFVDEASMAIQGKTVGMQWPLKVTLDTNIDIKKFIVDFDLSEVMDEYNEMSEEEKADFLFQKYSDTSYSIYAKHTETEEKVENDYYVETESTVVEASIEFDTEKGVTRAAFVVNNVQVKYVYGELYKEEGFDASQYDASFLKQECNNVKVKAQGEATFKYGDNVKVTLPEDLNKYIPMPLFK